MTGSGPHTTRTKLLVFLVVLCLSPAFPGLHAALFADGKIYDIGRLVYGNSTFVYKGEGSAQAAGSDRVQRNSTIFLERRGADLLIRNVSPEGKETPSRIGVDAQGRISTVEGEWGLTTFVYGSDGTRVSLSGPAGNKSILFKPGQTVYDFGLIIFMIGSFAVESLGEPLALKLVISSTSGLSVYDGYLKLLRRETIDIMGTRHPTLVCEVGLTGILGVFAPRLTAWVDLNTRHTLRILLPSGRMDLAELRSEGPSSP